MSEKKKIETPTDLLVSCVEDFGSCEPKQAIVIYTNENDNLCWRSTSMTVCERVGMLEVVKRLILLDLQKS